MSHRAITSRGPARTLGLGLLSIAVVLTATQVQAAPAHATTGDPIIIISPPPTSGDPDAARLTITQGGVVNGATSVTVTNPGGTAPAAQQCVPLSVKTEDFCLGQSSNELYPNGTIYPPIGPITHGLTAAGDLPGDGMDWVMSEAKAAVADEHGVENDDLVAAYARPEIRAYIQNRLMTIIDKKLYGQPMSTEEKQAYAALVHYYHDYDVTKANQSLAEYDRWSADPCRYAVPTPPPGLPYVPNPVATSGNCSKAGAFNFFQLTRGTPPSETFEKWAAYRHPSNLVRHATDTRVENMLGRTQQALVTTGAIGAVALLGVTAGISIATAAVAAAGPAGLSAVLVLGPIAIILVALIILAVAIYQIVEDAKPGDQIRDRAVRASTNDDPLGVTARMADYQGLDFKTRQDPTGQPPAVVHTAAFKDGLAAQINEWLMFDQGGDPIVDPTLGYSVTHSQPDDLHFTDGGQAVPNISLQAPPDFTDPNGHPVDSYRVLFSRGWLMVSEHRSDTGTWSEYRPQLSVQYVDQQGQRAQMSLLRHRDGNGPAQLDFLTTRPSLAPAQTNDVTGNWTYTGSDGQPHTVGLVAFNPMLLPVDVVPSAQGVMIADNTVTLNANLSTPGQSLPGTYHWTLDRLDTSGNVVESTTLASRATLAHRILQPGTYRATATYTVTGPPAYSRSGVVQFTVAPPTPEIMGASVRDGRALNGALSLDLRMLQQTRSDTFQVHVQWANDARGNTISRTYTVHCENAGGSVPGCDTGPMILPDDAPTNANWSESPTFRIPDDQSFLPEVRVTITNSFGQVVTRTIPIKPGEHRPTYASMTPYVVMPAGKFSRVDVVQVFPAPLLTASQRLTIHPFVQAIAKQLPPGVTPDIEERNGHWWLQLKGTPQADSIGSHPFFFSFEQEPLGSGFRPPPALVDLEVKSSTDHGYRAVLLGTPSAFLDRQYRNVYPNYTVQVNEVVGDHQAFTPFTGTVMCKLTAGPTTLLDRPCESDKPFPWPATKVSDTMEASVYLVSSTQKLSDDGPYSVDLSTKFVAPKITEVTAPKGSVAFQMTLRDLNVIQPPFSASGYHVTCSQDGSAFAPCLDNGTLTLPRTAGAHSLDVRVVAPDGAETVEGVAWSGGRTARTGATSRSPLTATVTSGRTSARALTQPFDLQITHGKPVRARHGYSVSCSYGGRRFVPCFDGWTQSVPRVPGRHRLIVRVEASDGSVVFTRVPWHVATPPTRLAVTAPSHAVRRGALVSVAAAHLLPREHYVVLLSSVRVASGLASYAGRVNARFRVPASARLGSDTLSVRGATARRVGSAVLHVTRG